MQFYIIGLFIIIFFYQISMYNSFKIKYETSINKLNKDVEKMKELQNQNKLVLDDLSKTVSSFENIDETIESVDEKIEYVDEKIEYVDGKIDTFEKIDDMYTEFQEEFGTQFDQVNQDMENQFEQVNQQMESQSEKTSTIEEKMKKIENDIKIDEEEKQQIEEESPFQKRLYDFQEKYLKGNETMIGVSSAVLALSSYFLVSRGKKKGDENINVTLESQDTDKRILSGNNPKTSGTTIQNIDRIDKTKAAATLTKLFNNPNRSPPSAITNTTKSNKKGKQSGGGKKQTVQNIDRIDKTKAAATLTKLFNNPNRSPPSAITNTTKSNQKGKQSTMRTERDKQSSRQERIPNVNLLTDLNKDNKGKLKKTQNKSSTQKIIPNVNLLTALNKDNKGKLKKTQNKPSTQKKSLLTELISGRNNLKKTSVQTKKKTPVNTTMNELALELQKRRGKIAPGRQSSGQGQSSRTSWSD